MVSAWSWLRLQRVGLPQPTAAIRLEQTAEIKDLHLPPSTLGCLHCQLATLRRKAQTHWIATGGKPKRMGPAVESVFNQNQPSVAALNDHGQIAPIPAQGG